MASTLPQPRTPGLKRVRMASINCRRPQTGEKMYRSRLFSFISRCCNLVIVSFILVIIKHLAVC